MGEFINQSLQAKERAKKKERSRKGIIVGIHRFFVAKNMALRHVGEI